jgi:predicted nuclease of restriction endonuclease-like (RecB) superfamily
MNKINSEFEFIINLIQKAQENAFLQVNKELVKLYFDVGHYISERVNQGIWGNSTVDNLADYIQSSLKNLKGFNRRGLYRMKQFYDTYSSHPEIVSTVLTQINWSCHLHILSKCNTPEEREFYIQLAVKEKYSVRELERQIESGLYERALLTGSQNVSTLLTQIQPSDYSQFKDIYLLEFLNLQGSFSESNLRSAIVSNLKDFILEFGREYSFIGEEYRIQAGNTDFFIDLLFFHRGLQCMVAIDLKITEFKPEYISKMNFYLELLDRKYRQPNENPSVGIILCKSKNDEIVEISLSRSLSPLKVAEYRTKLIDKKLLQNKLHELVEHFSNIE